MQLVIFNSEDNNRNTAINDEPIQPTILRLRSMCDVPHYDGVHVPVSPEGGAETPGGHSHDIRGVPIYQRHGVHARLLL